MNEKLPNHHFFRNLRFLSLSNSLSFQYIIIGITVNPQKEVRLSFPTLVFFVRLSFEVYGKLLMLGKSFLPQTKDLDTRVSKMA